MKRKFKSAAEKAAFEANQKSWDQLMTKYKPNTKVKPSETNLASAYALSNPPGRERVDVPSHRTSGGVGSKSSGMTYTGDNILGIGMMHKSNLVPIFNTDQAKDISSMRR